MAFFGRVSSIFGGKPDRNRMFEMLTIFIESYSLFWKMMEVKNVAGRGLLLHLPARGFSPVCLFARPFTVHRPHCISRCSGCVQQLMPAPNVSWKSGTMMRPPLIGGRRLLGYRLLVIGLLFSYTIKQPWTLTIQLLLPFDNLSIMNYSTSSTIKSCFGAILPLQ